MNKDEQLRLRLEVSRQVLDDSHFNIEHYDSKISTLLTVITILSGVLLLLVSAFITNSADLPLWLRTVVFVSLTIAVILAVSALLFIRKALEPHAPAGRKPNIRFCLDIAKGWDEESYVAALVGKEKNEQEVRQLMESVIEGNASSIYMMSHILKRKIKRIRNAVRVVVIAVVFLLFILLLVLSMRVFLTPNLQTETRLRSSSWSICSSPTPIFRTASLSATQLTPYQGLPSRGTRYDCAQYF